MGLGLLGLPRYRLYLKKQLLRRRLQDAICRRTSGPFPGHPLSATACPTLYKSLGGRPWKERVDQTRKETQTLLLRRTASKPCARVRGKARAECPTAGEVARPSPSRERLWIVSARPAGCEACDGRQGPWIFGLIRWNERVVKLADWFRWDSAPPLRCSGAGDCPLGRRTV